MESSTGHAGYSCGQGDEGADYWQEPSYEDGEVSPAGEKAVGPVELAAAHQDPATILFYQRAAAVGSDLVGDERSQIAADGSGSGYPEQLHFALEDQVSGEGHD